MPDEEPICLCLRRHRPLADGAAAHRVSRGGQDASSIRPGGYGRSRSLARTLSGPGDPGQPPVTRGWSRQAGMVRR